MSTTSAQIGIGSQLLLRFLKDGELHRVKLIKQEVHEGWHTGYNGNHEKCKKSRVGEIEENGVLYVSDASPLGRALLGRARGDIVTVEAPAGVFTWEIVKILDEPRSMP